ncbi:MAG: xylulokinase [Roseivirga sp.]|jgi:xylulokinase
MYLLGYDIGSSSVKAALIHAKTGNTLAIASFPKHELPIDAPTIGWAEQDPEMWWECVQKVTAKLLAKVDQPMTIQGIGISYQMHGLVMVDENQRSIRPAIIWCDSRAVKIGEEAFEAIGPDNCLSSLLNSPGHFTASKLKWVKENEPTLYAQIYKIMLPGDFIAMKMTGQISTTITGLSEGIFWDFKKNSISTDILNHFGFDSGLLPPHYPSIANHGVLNAESAQLLGLNSGIQIGYKAGDQPNNAMALGVLNPGEIAATGGTSGVVYGVVDQPIFDPLSRVNSFAHINHQANDPKIGVLLCINGAGIQYSWLRKMIGEINTDYNQLELMASKVAVGANGLTMLPFGNGTERILENQNLGAHWMNLQFNTHGKGHLIRAALEGIAFSFVYGIEIMKAMGIDVSLMKVGNDNLFQSSIFSTTIASILDCKIEMVETNGAIGAARAAGVAIGCYENEQEAFSKLEIIRTYQADTDTLAYQKAYEVWKNDLEKLKA